MQYVRRIDTEKRHIAAVEFGYGRCRSEEGGYKLAETIDELRNLPKEEVVRRHDATAEHTVVGTQHYLDELARRDAVSQGERMERLTASINRLTWIITGATIIGVVLTIVSLLSG